MRQYRPAPRPLSDAATGSGRPEPPPGAVAAPSLTLNKVLAGAGAAATSAVLGSYFGAAGTVSGAALGSVASTLASVVYQRSLDHTRDRLVARVRLGGGRKGDGATVATAAEHGSEPTIPMPRVSPEPATVRIRVEPDVRPPWRPTRRWLVTAGLATVLVFALGLLAVTGVEWVKGSTITRGQSGTSVGRVLGGGGGGGGDADDDGAAEAHDRTSDPTTAAPTPAATAGPTDDPTSAPQADTGATGEPTRTSGSAARSAIPTTAADDPDARDEQHEQDDSDPTHDTRRPVQGFRDLAPDDDRGAPSTAPGR